MSGLDGVEGWGRLHASSKTLLGQIFRVPPAPEDCERSAPFEATIMQRKCRNKLAEGLACVKNDQNYSLSFWRSIILPSDPVTRTCLESLDFQGFQRIVQFRDISKEHVSRRAAKEPRCFLPWVQVHLGSQHICKARSAAFRCNTLIIGVLEKPQRTTGSPPPYKVPPQSNAGGQKVVSKVKFALPPFYLFMAMTPWCG